MSNLTSAAKALSLSEPGEEIASLFIMQKKLILFLVVFLSATFSRGESEVPTLSKEAKLVQSCLKSFEFFPCGDAFEVVKDPALSKQLVAGASIECQQHGPKIMGLDLCLMLGIYSFAHNQVDLGKASLKRDCPRNPSSCLALTVYYADHEEEKEAVAFATQLCKDPDFYHWLRAFMDNGGPKEESVCESILKNSTLPERFLKEAGNSLYQMGFPELPDPRHKKTMPADGVADCLEKGQNCSFTLRYFTTKENILQVADKLSHDCLLKTDRASGATDCNIVSAYYLKIGDDSKVVTHLEKDCATNVDACVLLSGFYLKKQKTELALEYALKYCDLEINGLAHEVSSLKYAKENCPGIKKEKRLPASFKERTESLWEGYLGEQKSPEHPLVEGI